MGNKKELAIVFGITGNLAFALANVIMGLKKHSSHLNFEIIVFHQEISEKDQNLMNLILPCEFVEYKFPISSEKREGIPLGLSLLVYSRYECFNLLDKYKKVLWLDVDILIQKDISSILDYCSTGIALLNSLEDSPLYINFLKPIEGFDFERQAYGSGTMLLQDNLPNYKDLTQWCYEKTLEWKEYITQHDQSIINLMLQEFSLECIGLPAEIFNTHPIRKDTSKATILHSYATRKFWNFYFFKEWDKNYKDWIKMGGSKYTGKSRISLILKYPRKFVRYLLSKGFC